MFWYSILVSWLRDCNLLLCNRSALMTTCVHDNSSRIFIFAHYALWFPAQPDPSNLSVNLKCDESKTPARCVYVYAIKPKSKRYGHPDILSSIVLIIHVPQVPHPTLAQLIPEEHSAFYFCSKSFLDQATIKQRCSSPHHPSIPI